MTPKLERLEEVRDYDFLYNNFYLTCAVTFVNFTRGFLLNYVGENPRHEEYRNEIQVKIESL